MDADRKAYSHQRHALAVAAALSEEVGGSLQQDVIAARAVGAGHKRLCAIAELVRLDRLDHERGQA